VKLLKIFRFNARINHDVTVVTFTGGMGAQIISAAIYFSFKKAGRKVYADLSYFEKSERVAVVGNAGECSHWAWQLDRFGLWPASFEVTPSTLSIKKINLLEDGARKLELGLQALAEPEVQRLLQIPASIHDVLPDGFGTDYLCIHIRRGDYVNVASHLVSDDEFIKISKKFSGLVNNLIVLSDSKISSEFRLAVTSSFKNVAFLDKTDPYTAHCVMRHAKILICSNSQFSLIAAILNSNALVIIPKTWFGKDQSHLAIPINALCKFSIIDGG
jgi:hypothetical protein